MKLDLQKENKKIEMNQINGIKLSFFKMIYVLLQNQDDNIFRDVIFIIAQFVQLIAFPLSKAFDSSWKTYWYGTIGHFFRYFQIIYLFERDTENSSFYIIAYIITALYILIFIILVIYSLNLLSNYLLKSHSIIGILLTIYEFECIVNIPFLKILFAVFELSGESLDIAPAIKIKSFIHILMFIISIILTIVYLILIILFHMTLFEFGAIHGKIRAAYTSSTEVLLVIMKFVMVVSYQFITNELALAIITCIVSVFLLFDFLGKQPFINDSISKLYFILYLLFVWSSVICIIAYLLKNTEFEAGILLLILGYPFIILTIVSKNLEYSMERVFEYVGNKYKDGYSVLMEIEYFLKLEDCLEDKVKPREQKILYFYINNYERDCTDPDCSLKQFLRMELNIKNFSDMKICLLQHAEMLYKNAVSKYPFNAKLRLSYAIFLYKRLNKKQKGTNEILLLNKYTTNLEDSFLIYRAQRFIEEENEGRSDSESNSKIVNSVTYKAILNNIKVLIGKITNYYIDFWTILAISDESKSENFQKMSRIGTKISKFNEDLICDFERLERVNLFDQDTIKLYAQYLSEILNNHTLANTYNNKLNELEQKRHQFNEENLFDMNYKAMARSEDYKYIVISGAQNNFNIIINISLCICPMFGFSKEELIGKPLDFLLPELFSIHHKKILVDKIEDFKKTILAKHKNMSLKVRSEPKIIQTFAKTKMKYLVPIKMKISLVASEEGNIFGVSRIIAQNFSLMANEEQIVYILTDNELIVQNFTPNAPKLLCLDSSSINNNLEITDFIKEFTEELYKELEQYDDIKENSAKIMKKMKIEVLNRMFADKDTRKVVTWRFNEILKNNENSGNNYKNIWSIQALKNNFGKEKHAGMKNQSAITDNVGRAFKLHNNSKESSKMHQSGFEVKNANSEIKKVGKVQSVPEKENQEIYNKVESDNFQNQLDINNLISKNNINKSLFHKFILSVSDVQFGETKIGHIFRFEVFDPQKMNNESSQIGTKMSTKIGLGKPPTIKDKTELISSDISLMSFTPNMVKPVTHQVLFNVTNDNPNGINLGLDDTYIPVLEPENEFYIDGDKLSFKQRGKENENFKKEHEFEKFRQKAADKIQKLKNENEDEEEEEEEEESYDEEDENGSKENSEKASENKEINEIIKSELSDKEKDIIGEKITPGESKEKENKSLDQLSHKVDNKAHVKHKQEDDFYHVNTKNITFLLFNFTTGFVQPLNDPKFKISKVTNQLEKEKEKLSKMNSKFIANPKAGRERKKGASASSKQIMGDEELDAYSKKKIKLKEIQKALASKEKQASIINLCIFSFVVFVLVIGTSVASILMNSYFYDQIIIYYNLIEKSVTLYRNLIFEINFVRELILLNHTGYTNLYDLDKDAYYKNNSETCYEYYVETAYVLSNLSTILNSLTEETKQKTAEKEGPLVLVDVPVVVSSNSSNETGRLCGVNITKDMEETMCYTTKTYKLKIYSAFHELNAALYHVSQLKKEEIFTYDIDVYYFLANSMNSMLLISEEQIDVFTEEFYGEISKVHKIIIICYVILFLIYALNFIIFIYFYQKVEERKQSYLSVFYEIGSNFIVTSLAKCEKFSQRIQLQDDMIGAGEKISISSSTEESDMDNELGSISSLSKIKNSTNNNAGKARNVKKTSNIKMKIGGFIVIFLLLCVQIFAFSYYYIRNDLYQHYVQYEYYNNKYNSRFLFPYIAMREYLYDQKKTLLNEEVDKYLDTNLRDFYKDLAEISNERDAFTSYLPESYSTFVDELFRDNQCKYIEVFIGENHTNFTYYNETSRRSDHYSECNDFYYNTSAYGFQAVLTTYIEEIRIMRDLEKYYLQNAEKYDFKYNESLIGTAYEYYLYPNITKYNIEHYPEFKGNQTILTTTYNNYNPVLILNEDTHKHATIIFRFVVMKIVQSALDNLFDAIHEAFEETTTVCYIINITFMALVTIGFFLFWLPFVLGENDTIYKTKNMLSIIPNEVLFTLPHINIMLGIDEEGN